MLAHALFESRFQLRLNAKYALSHYNGINNCLCALDDVKFHLHNKASVGANIHNYIFIVRAIYLASQLLVVCYSFLYHINRY
jgi:hypothetical protein